MLRIGLLICLLLPGLALANNGRILYVTGTVTVERGGKLYRAVKNAKVIQGDTIKTGRRGRLHMRMSDRTLVSLKPSSNFQIQTYRFDRQRSAASARRSGAQSQRQAQSEDRSIFRLVKGGFRAITGLIGKRNRSAFGVSTPVATIGIRGTSFVANLSGDEDGSNLALNKLDGVELAALSDAVDMPVLGSASMSDADGLVLAQASGAGSSSQKLTVGVADGSVILSNKQGSLILENGEYGEVLAGGTPSRLLVPPADNDDVMQQQDGNADDSEQQGSDTRTKVATRVTSMDTDTSTGGRSDQAPPGAAEEPTTEETEFIFRRNVATSSGLNDTSNSLTLSEGAQRADENGRVIALITDGSPAEGVQTAAVSLVEGQVSNAGLDPQTALHWGRWSGGQVQLDFADGSQQTISTEQANLHFIQSVVSNDVPAMPSTGSSEFALIGNTDPTTDAGSAGFLGHAHLSANFTEQTVDSDLALSVNEQLWEASGSGDIGSGLGEGTPANVFAGDYDAVQVDRELDGNGQFSGFFTDQAGAAGLSYRLNQGETSVSGVAAFEAVGAE